MPYYRPRFVATLTVPVVGTRSQRVEQAGKTSTVDLVVHPKSIHLERNDHNHADSCSIECDWTEAGVDPRLLDSAVLAVYIADADDTGFWVPDETNCRFIGIVKEIEAERNAGSPPHVKIDALDYTTLFLEAKPFGSSGIPDYTQTLDQAWSRVVSQTPGAEALADRLLRNGLAVWPELGSAVAERFKKTAGRIPVHPETDAWAVWQQCVGMMGLLSYVELDQCVVTTARNLYTEKDPPVLIWGQHLKSWRENRHSGLARKGVGVASIDPVTGTTLEAFFPPVGDERVRHKKAAAKKIKSAGEMMKREDREYFTFPGITDQDALERFAERVYEERSRQELDGRIVTAEMSVETESKAAFDLLALKAGDSVQVTLDPKDRQLLASLPTDGARMRYLETRGYTEEVAELIVANMSEFGALESKFFVRSVGIEAQVEADGGSFEVTIDYVNRIQLDGSTDK